eukprot:CAMPEP_0182866284 /NCGR_PEP_ID=MMETSP0034_2-20130328/8130_1 /TAXON_ID=156128 /ORGANISM="Nephroselmis pyriformis, Strain CCMP717" /LENGTH=103 /DNA_ID=CAMNT_0024998611 /DNA_START=72 /DNA_END=383 /DNA_ORIENTATION=+
MAACCAGLPGAVAVDVEAAAGARSLCEYLWVMKRKKSRQSSSNTSQLSPLLSSAARPEAEAATAAFLPPFFPPPAFFSSSYILRGERHPMASHGEILQEKLAE